MIKTNILNYLQEHQILINIFDFALGFTCGFVTVIYHKNIIAAVIEYFKQKNETKPKIKFICKITDTPLFDEYFPKFKNQSAPRTQPYWEFSENLIKIDIDTPIDVPISFENLLSDIDLPLFESFGKIYVYIHYNNFINIYLPESTIDLLDFEPKETELSLKYKNIIYAAFTTNDNTIYITSYLKSFFNNTIELTPELLSINHPNVNSLKIVNKEFNVIFNLHETI